MKKLLPLLAFALVLPAAAHADTFSFSFSSIDYTGSGTFFADLSPTVSNQYLINNVTGSANGLTIASLTPPDPSPDNFEDNDNLLFSPPSPGYFDLNGVSFQLSDGTQINLFFDPNSGYGTYFMSGTNNPNEEDAVVVIANTTPTAPIAVTPEPSSLMLLGTGALGLVSAVRRRFNR